MTDAIPQAVKQQCIKEANRAAIDSHDISLWIEKTYKEGNGQTADNVLSIVRSNGNGGFSAQSIGDVLAAHIGGSVFDACLNASLPNHKPVQPPKR